ncbi:hypothetical protein Hypma_012786 [Hypsizygus marmoreus]|uniref:Uncharacterized protein n=1 Tax=Hypsizygus marmoreus TaxID=39966 RepID=A0A369JD91_HYPMA|nr:hypothetical protein Hypma_012786 [Hypsizygus marmoreus]
MSRMDLYSCRLLRTAPHLSLTRFIPRLLFFTVLYVGRLYVLSVLSSHNTLAILSSVRGTRSSYVISRARLYR